MSYGEPPQILGSIGYTISTDSVRFFVVDGVVYNTLGANVKLNVTATFYAAQNFSLGTSYGGTSLKILRPGQKAPFTIYFALNSTDDVSRYDLAVSYVETDEQPFDVLEFRNVENRSEDSRLVIVGEVWNGRPFKALNVGVACICYNASGGFCGLYRTFIRSIDGGESGNFTIGIDDPLLVARFDLVAYSGGYEYTFIANYVFFAFLVLAFVVFLVFMKRRGW
ncbi:MAG: hypothetical protein QXE06_00690 [Candidatus Bathyarchaeia archaeon]